MRPVGARTSTTTRCDTVCCDALCFLLVVVQCVLSSVAEGDYYYKGQDKQRFLRSSLQNVKSYEITHPRWLLHPDTHKRPNTEQQQHPSETQVLITAEGQELSLHLERNEQLLAPGYQDIWYGPSGERRSSSPSNTDQCFYHGTVQGMEGSSVVVSTCSGLRGLISLNTSVSYLIEPLAPVAMDTMQPHAVFRAESLRLPGGTCMHHHHGNQQERGGEEEEGRRNFIRGMAMPPLSKRERRDLSQNMKYVELLLVADHAEFEKQRRDLEMTKMKLLEAANYVDKYYKALGIRVAVIGLEVWSHQDRINMSANPYSTLGAFLAWRRKQLHTLPNDNAQLVTGMSFEGTTIGLAPLKAMCSEYQSGGVNSDHSESAVGVAATMAHEMGHNFGMSHDSSGCCQARGEDGGCIMAAATGHPFPRVFNSCNQKELKRYLSSGGGKCLFNMPNTRAMYGGQRCGNGYLEEGEECDCGEEEECTSPCCNANNCTLKAGAECAHGVCCENCKLKSPGVLCRASSGSCDLPEYCDGKAESCPANFYLVDGISCAAGMAYCYTGMCLTLDQQCQALWGRDGRPAPDLCFERVNEAGDTFGNCGKDLLGKYRGCKERDAKCGKIQCLSSAAKPMENNAVPIDTSVRVGTRKILCRGTHVYRDGGQGDTLDPGLVMTGTKCGDDSICFGGECRNASFLRADECNAKCHGHGLCNNNHNCHCDSGWAPPLCEHRGTGGSVDSGPVISHTGNLLPFLMLLPVLVFVMLAAVGLWCCFRHKRPLKTSAPPPPIPVCSVPNEGAKPLQANGQTADRANGHANPTFLLRRQDSDRLTQSSPRPSPRSRHAIVRPTTKPPPIPAYAAGRRAERQAQTQQSSPHQTSSQPRPTPPVPGNLTTRPSGSQGGQPSPPPSHYTPPVPSLDVKPHPSPSGPRKHRPEPPSRPPPPCPANKPSPDQNKERQATTDSLQRGKESLSPSAGQSKPNGS